MGPYMNIRISVLLTLLASFTSFSLMAADGVITKPSVHGVTETMDTLQAVLESKGMTIFARIDHGAGAAGVGITIPATELLIFGNPKVGSPLMQCERSVAIDLPQKALVWEDTEGKVWLSYNDPDYLRKRHAISGCDQQLKKVTDALDALTSAATASQ